tara:strand:- start:144 stop:473 length:330 start_codon:yes stop_codon:yes gene_type:complete
MFTLKDFANFVSLIGTGCGLFSRVPQVIKTYKSKSANDLSDKTMIINIFANSCFLFYMIVNEEYFIMFNCISVITLEGSLLFMKSKFKHMKKSSSQKSLVDMIEEENDI